MDPLKRISPFSCLACLFLCFSAWVGAVEKNVQICIGDGSEWAPFTYWERTAEGEINKDKLIGSATELVIAALKELGYQHSIRYMPWARVQAVMADYSENPICDMSWDASFKEERFKKYYYSIPLYRTHLGVFYSKKKFNFGPPIHHLEDLKHFELCGVAGFNYDRFKLGDNIVRVNKVEQVLKLIDGQRCDLFPSEIETIYGGVSVGAFTLSQDIQSMRLPGLFKTFYAILSKQSPLVKELIVPFNQTLIRLQAIGETERIFKKYLPGGTGL